MKSGDAFMNGFIFLDRIFKENPTISVLIYPHLLMYQESHSNPRFDDGY